MSWFLTFVYTGQLSNEVVITLNGSTIEPQNFTINRQRTTEVAHPVGGNETVAINKSQVLSFGLSFIYDNSAIHKTVIRNIKNPELAKLNETFTLTVNYPQLNVYNQQGQLVTAETNTYTVVLVDGGITINQGSYLLVNATFSIAG
jgi:hypothetical protein